jgi:hypothetical protein
VDPSSASGAWSIPDRYDPRPDQESTEMKADRIGDPIREDDVPFELPDPTFVPEEWPTPEVAPDRTPEPDKVPA